MLRPRPCDETAIAFPSADTLASWVLKNYFRVYNKPSNFFSSMVYLQLNYNKKKRQIKGAFLVSLNRQYSPLLQHPVFTGNIRVAFLCRPLCFQWCCPHLVKYISAAACHRTLTSSNVDVLRFLPINKQERRLNYPND